MGILAEALKDSGLLDTDRPVVAPQQPSAANDNLPADLFAGAA